jgi:hypothetical protein
MTRSDILTGLGHGWCVTPTEGIEPEPSRFHRSVQWMFSSRRTGRLTVAQWPNHLLVLFIVITVAVHVFHQTGSQNPVRVLAQAVLLVWAVDEVVRGVNPFRRILGFGVAVVTILSL